MTDNAVVREYDEQYKDAYYAWNPFYPLADRDLRYFLGDQWDEQEKQKLFEEGRNAYVFNLIRRNINLLTGYQRKHRLSSIVNPIEDSDQLGADQLSQLLLYIMNYGDGYKIISECFGGALKTGFNLMNIWMDYRNDPINGDVKFSRDPYNGFIVDPYFTQLDFSDCAYIIKRKYLTAQQASSILPEHTKEIFRLAKLGWSRDDKFTWLPYQKQPNGDDYVAYNEFYKQNWINATYLINKETGISKEWKGDDETADFYLSKYPYIEKIKRQKRIIECHVIINDQYIRTDINKYGLNEYPFVPFVGVFEPESELWSLKLQSLIRCQIDPQREANRRRSQMIDILDSSINSGWIAKKDTVVNPRSLFQTSQGKVIWKQPHAEQGDIEKIQPASIPEGMFALQKQFDQDIMTICGVNDANFGVTENEQESGIMMMLRQGASIVNLQDIFDNLRYAQKLISKKALKMILSKEENKGWNDLKISRIINSPPAPNLRDPEMLKYDITIREGILTDTQQQIYFRQLVDLKQLGVPVTGEMLADAAPLQGKSRYTQQIAQVEQQQAQVQQQAQQIEMAKLQSELEYNKAASIDRLGSGKERFTRAVANMGLEDERAARAIDDRSQAALNRVQAMKELESMDDDKLVKYMEIIQMMEEVNRAKEEQVKQDDVTISARGTANVQSRPQISQATETKQPSEV